MPKLQMSSVRICPVCKGSETDLVEACEGYEFRNCPRCEIEFVSPMAAGDGEYYEAIYGTRKGDYGEDRWEYGNFFSDAKKYGIRGKLLDIGCGPGWFLQKAEEKGFEVCGIDVNAAAINFAKRLGLSRVELGDINEVEHIFPGERFNAITLFHVLEHLEDPAGEVRRLRSILAPGGVLVIGTPNAKRSVLRFNFRARREAWDYPPHHLTRWDKVSLGKFFKKEGFEVMRIEEEQLKGMKKVMRFSKDVWYLWTKTGMVAHFLQKAETGEEKKRAVYVMRGLSLLRDTANLIFAIFLTPLFGAVNQVRPLSGTHLYALVRKDKTE